MKKAMLIISTVLLCVSLSACGAQSKLTSAIEQGDFLTASSVFESASSKDELIKVIVQKTETAFSEYDTDTISALSQAFFSEDIDEFKTACLEGLESAYQAFMDGAIEDNVFENINDACILVVGAEITSEYSLATEKIRDSRQAFADAQEAETKEDYTLAYQLYSHVIEEDEKNFKMAQSKMSELSEEVLNPPVIHIGESIESDHFKITFIDFFKKSSLDFGYKPTSGFTYGCIAIKLENITSEQVTYFASDFTYYADNEECEYAALGYWSPATNGYKYLDTNDLEAGRAVSGYEACELPVDAKSLEVEFDGVILSCEIN